MSDNKFNYTYSAPTEEEREEIDIIRRQYMPLSDKDAKLNRLRHLDGRVKSIPQVISLCVGILGLLLFGFGLALVLEWDLLALGIVIMLISTPIIGIAYPVYSLVLVIYKDKYGEEILKLSEELLKD